MGDPKKIRKKYAGPGHPWQKSRLDEEKILVREYNLKNKKELWKMISVLKKYTNQAKKLTTTITKQGEKEKEQLIKKLARLGLLSTEAKTEDVLSLNIKDILERRLQTVVFRKGLAKTINQARQFIVHEHLKVNDRKITSPGHLVMQSEEATIQFCEKSNLANIEHPERLTRVEEITEPEKIEKEKKATTKKKNEEKKSKKIEKKKEMKKSESKEEVKIEKKEENKEKINSSEVKKESKEDKKEEVKIEKKEENKEEAKE